MTSLVMIRRYPGPVRASRLVGLLGLLQAQGQMTTQQLAAELEVSPRTVLRDIEALSSAGIPVYATRGRRGGFALIDGFSSELPGSRLGERQRPEPGARQARIRVSPRGRRLAALQGRPAGFRIRHGARPVAGRGDWAEAWVRIDSIEAAVLDLLALGPEVEVLHPPQLRAQMARAAGQIAGLHHGPP